MQLVIIPTVKVPHHSPPIGWRKWAAKFGFPVRQARMVLHGPTPQELYCHPETVVALCRYLADQGHTYVVKNTDKPLASVTPIKRPKQPVFIPGLY